MAWVDLTSVGRSHSFQLAKVLEELGVLRKLHTGVVVPRVNTGLGRAARLLPDADQRRLAKRANSVSPEFVRPVPTAELLEQSGRRLFRRGSPRPWNYAASAYFDKVVARRERRDVAPIVHAFEHSALHTLRAARAMGAVTVLEQPIIHIDKYLELEDLVLRRTGVATIRRPLGWRTHIERKHKEYALADYCFTGLPTARDSMEAGGYPADRIFVTPYGVPDSSWTSDLELAPRSPNDPLRVLFVGHVDFYKGLDVMLDAWQLLPDSGFTLTVLGLVERTWAPFFFERMAELDRVTYRPPVPTLEMAGVYRDHDVLAFPSLVGGIGLAVFEALASGLVAVLPHDEETLTDGVDCVLADLNEPASWANALTRLRDDRVRFERLSANGIETARQVSSTRYRSSVREAYGQIAERENLRDMKTLLDSGS